MLGVSALHAADGKVVWLDEMNLNQATSGWGGTQAKMTVDKHPLTLRGKVYERGIGTHPPGGFRIELNGSALRFKAIAGVDDEVGKRGSVEFSVMGDGKKLWSSGVLTGGGDIKPCDIDLKGLKFIDLIVDTTSDGYAFDHSDWADARIEYQGDKAPTSKGAPKPARPPNPITNKWPPADQVFDKNSLPDPADKDEADAVLRRVGALITHLKTLPRCPDLKQAEERLAGLKAQAGLLDAGNARRGDLLDEACKLRREVAFANPLLDFTDILFVTRTIRQAGDEAAGDHMCDQYYGHNGKSGGRLCILKNAFSANPTLIDVVKDAKVQNGRLAGQSLMGGSFLSPELSYDAKTIYFAWSPGSVVPAAEYWTRNASYHIFKVNVDGTDLVQLTDGMWDDFDPCLLPNGRIVFVSGRCSQIPGTDGGLSFLRCGRFCPTYNLHSMKADGSDIYPISYHETHEWHPSVNNEGMLVYTRWDYIDRNFSAAHHIWVSYPDGSDPRSYHGNYPMWRWEGDPVSPDGRTLRPFAEHQIRAIPNSKKYIATADAHHGQSFGSLVLIDQSIEDDGKMSQVKRITPDAAFPESEIGCRTGYAYGTAWPLSEMDYLCNYQNDIILLDATGNKSMVHPCDQAAQGFRAIDPIPVKPRAKPPVLAARTRQGVDAGSNPPKATLSVLNVYTSDFKWPEGAKVKWLRIIHYLPKTTNAPDDPKIGFGSQNAARMPLGVVPVEEDGSAFFEAPVGKCIYFQALDSLGMAITSMRSATYVHSGEQLSCVGCHENKWQAAPRSDSMAHKRPPSPIQPEFTGHHSDPTQGGIPFNYYLLVKPVFDQKCIPCHTQQSKGFTSSEYAALRPFACFFNGGGDNTGSRVTPGKFGARASRMGKALLTPEHRDRMTQGKFTQEDVRRIVMWLDCASDELGAYSEPDQQRAGKVVWPVLQVNPADPLGLKPLAADAAASHSAERTEVIIKTHNH